MTGELNEYKQKVTVMGNSRPYGNQKPVGFGYAAINNLSDVNFQFEFPKFGMLPGPPIRQSSRSSSSQSPQAAVSQSNPVSPFSNGNNLQSRESRSPFSMNADSPLDKQTKDDLAVLSGIFSPPLTANTIASASRNSLDSGHYSVGATATSSPSASSISNMGPSSSCGTSPEPFTQSPMGFKPVDTLTTIGEEQPSLSSDSQSTSQFAGIDINPGIDWLAQQNGGQFDPQLFGDYREPQENILANTTFDDSFFNDALDADFFTPYNVAPSPAVSKKSLIGNIDAEQIADDDGASPRMLDEKLSCNKMWYVTYEPIFSTGDRCTDSHDREKLQNCPKVQSGEFDLDGLCAELQKKAKCSGSGPVVAETDFDAVVNKWMGKECAELKAASKQ
jgi:AP-1-like transcription factor